MVRIYLLLLLSHNFLLISGTEFDYVVRTRGKNGKVRHFTVDVHTHFEGTKNNIQNHDESGEEYQDEDEKEPAENEKEENTDIGNEQRR